MIAKKQTENSFVTGAHLRPSAAHGAGCVCCISSEDEDSDEHQNERGNVLWIILLAVALLAALTMVLSRGGSNTDQTGSVEQYKISASQIMRYARGIEAAVQEMTLRGASENDISFQNADTAVDYTNANCTVSDCRLFDVDGAGLVYRAFDGANDGSEWIFTAANNVGTTADPVGTTAASSGNDILMLLPNVQQSLCIQINRDLGVGTAGTLPIETTGIATTAFVGAFVSGGPTILDGDPTPFELNNENAGCFIDASDSNKIYFYYVVLAR